MTLEIVRTNILTKKAEVSVSVTITGFSTVDAAKRFLQSEFRDAVTKADGQVPLTQESLS